MPDDMSASPAASPDQRKLMEEKRAQWDAITQKRMEMIAAEKAKANERTSADQSKQQRDRAAYQAEVAAERTRSDEREVWRQEQHTKREEEERQRQQAEAQKALEAEEQKKRDAADAERQEYMSMLHKIAVAHKIRDKRESVEEEAVRETKVATDIAERMQHQLDEDTERALHHLEADRQRHLGQVRVDDERRRKAIDEKARFAIMDAHTEWKKADDAARHMQDRMAAGEAISAAHLQESRTKMRIEGERKRDLLTLDEETQAKLFAIEQESKHLKDELLKNADTKKLLIARQEDRKKQETERRKENFEKWLKDV